MQLFGEVEDEYELNSQKVISAKDEDERRSVAKGLSFVLSRGRANIFNKTETRKLRRGRW